MFIELMSTKLYPVSSPPLSTQRLHGSEWWVSLIIHQAHWDKAMSNEINYSHLNEILFDFSTLFEILAGIISS